jgi:hypothetical protein
LAVSSDARPKTSSLEQRLTASITALADGRANPGKTLKNMNLAITLIDIPLQNVYKPPESWNSAMRQ